MPWNPGTYLRPHRRLTPPKAESYIVLRGKLEVLIFDNEGNVLHRVTLNPEIGNYCVDIPAGIWHSMIVKQSETVIYETKEGTFSPMAMEDFAVWSPDLDNEETVKAFFKQYS
jgi:cupin fold WbuC family metalloprotein